MTFPRGVADAGFERGDVIVEVDRKPITSVAELRESVDPTPSPRRDELRESPTGCGARRTRGTRPSEKYY